VVEGFGFSKAKHLVKTDEISSVFSFNSRFSSEHFQILVKPGMHVYARMTVIVSKKTARLAVARNYVKRVSREIFRMQQYKLAGLDLVIRVRKSFTAVEYVVIEQELLAQLNRAQQKHVRPDVQKTS